MRYKHFLLAVSMAAGSIAFAQTPPIEVSATSLSFSAIAGGNVPVPSQRILVTTADLTVTGFSVASDSGAPGTPSPTWLVIHPMTAAAPASITVGVNPTGLAAGTYTARILLTNSRGVSLSPPIPVTLQVTTTAPQLVALPNAVRLYGTLDAPTSTSQIILVRDNGTGPLGPITVAVTSATPWLRPVLLSCPQDCLVQITAAFTGLTPGPYLGNVQISSSIGSVNVPVSLQIAGHDAFLAVTPSGLSFEATQGEGSALAQNLTIVNRGDVPLLFGTSVVAGGSWLSLGTSQGLTVSSEAISVMVKPGTLLPGNYTGLIQITSADPTTENTPQLVPVSLQVDPATTVPTPILSPGGLVFTAITGASPAPVMPVMVQASTITAVKYSAVTQVDSTTNTSWLSVSPGQGTVSAALPTSLNVTASSASLQPGVYTGEVNVGLGTNNLRTANVTLFVTPPMGSKCSSVHLYPTEISLVNNFSIPAGTSTPLTVALNDNCGTPITNGSVIATFSNGDPALGLTNQGGGLYSATWTPETASATLQGGTLSIRFTAASPQLGTGVAELIGTVQATSLPVLAPYGTLNNFGAQIGGPIAPGTVVQIFGSGFAMANQSGSFINGLLPTTLGGVSVSIGGVAAPLFFVGTGQIDAQLPFELAPNRQYQVVVTVNGLATAPDTITVVPLAPAIATLPDGTAIAQTQVFSLITAASPAHPGEYIVLYLTAMGATNPPVASGAQSPSQPLATVTNAAKVTFNGENANVVFAGLTPGFVGLYQVDVQVPADAAAGMASVVVTQAGVSSNTALLPID